MKPTLEQIAAFGLELVEKDTFHTVKDKEYSQVRHAKRYNKQVVLYVAMIYYDYPRAEVASYFKISDNAVSQAIGKVRTSRMKQELADELFDSLNILYEAKKEVSLAAYTAKLLPIFANENDFNIRSTGDLNKLEKWLINRLYEVENK